MTQAQQQPNRADTLHQEALTLLRAGKLKEGIEVLHDALELNPGSGDIHNDMATAIWQTGQLELARTHYEKAIKLENTRPHIYNNYGYFLLETGNPAAAERLLKKAVDLKPDFTEAMTSLGQCLQMQGKFEAAEQVYLAAIRLKPEQPEAHFNIGTLYARMLSTDRAEAAFRKVIQLAPGHFRAWYEIARLCYSKGDLDQCLDCLNKAKTINPKFKPAWSQLITVLAQRGDKNAADEAATQALALFPGDPGLLLDRAIDLRQQERYQEALDTLDRVEEDAREWPHILFERAYNYQALDKIDRAFAAYDKGNTLRKSHMPSPAMQIKALQDYQRTFTKEWVQSWSAASVDPLTIKPIFVVSFPGAAGVILPPAFFDKTDVELTHGAPAISNVVRYVSDTLEQNYPSGISTLTDEQIAQARRIYIESLRASGLRLTDGHTIVDTSPTNIVHAGLIHRIFPEASFIVAQSHPYDEILMGFMENPIAHDAAIRTYNLTEAARLYGHSFRLWEHYRATLALPMMADYREPGRNLWKAYKPHIESIFPILEPWAEKYGYPVK